MESAEEAAAAAAAAAALPEVDPVVDGYVKPTFADDVYLVRAGSAVYVTGADWAAAGYPTVKVVATIPGTGYFQIRGRDTVVAVLPGGPFYPLTYPQWAVMGTPQPAVVSSVPGLNIQKVPEYPSLWLVGPDRVGRKLDYERWALVGTPSYAVVGVIAGSWIVKIPTWDALWAIAPDNTARQLDTAAWASVGYAPPATVTAIPGSWYSKTTEVPTVWAIAPNGNWRAISEAEWAGLGYPPVQTFRWGSGQSAVTAQDLWASYRSGCPVGPEGLSKLQVWYWGFDGQLHQGNVVLARAVVAPVEATFHAAFNARFPFRDVSPVDKYYGDDVMSMSADNTSAFNCRTVTGNPRQLSQHSYGNAIDYDTFENPYVTSAQVFPAGSETYLNRGWVRPGMIRSGDAIAGTMAAYGWPWGARWANPDYQHFSSNGG